MTSPVRRSPKRGIVWWVEGDANKWSAVGRAVRDRERVAQDRRQRFPLLYFDRYCRALLDLALNSRATTGSHGFRYYVRLGKPHLGRMTVRVSDQAVQSAVSSGEAGLTCCQEHAGQSSRSSFPRLLAAPSQITLVSQPHWEMSRRIHPKACRPPAPSSRQSHASIRPRTNTNENRGKWSSPGRTRRLRPPLCLRPPTARPTRRHACLRRCADRDGPCSAAKEELKRRKQRRGEPWAGPAALPLLRYLSFMSKRLGITVGSVTENVSSSASSSSRSR